MGSVLSIVSELAYDALELEHAEMAVHVQVFAFFGLDGEHGMFSHIHVFTLNPAPTHIPVIFK